MSIPEMYALWESHSLEEAANDVVTALRSARARWAGPDAPSWSDAAAGRTRGPRCAGPAPDRRQPAYADAHAGNVTSTTSGTFPGQTLPQERSGASRVLLPLHSCDDSEGTNVTSEFAVHSATTAVTTLGTSPTCPCTKLTAVAKESSETFNLWQLEAFARCCRAAESKRRADAIDLTLDVLAAPLRPAPAPQATPPCPPVPAVLPALTPDTIVWEDDAAARVARKKVLNVIAISDDEDDNDTAAAAASSARCQRRA